MTKEDWEEFYTAWLTIVYAYTIEDFEKNSSNYITTISLKTRLFTST